MCPRLLSLTPNLQGSGGLGLPHAVLRHARVGALVLRPHLGQAQGVIVSDVGPAETGASREALGRCVQTVPFDQRDAPVKREFIHQVSCLQMRGGGVGWQI